MGTRGEEPSIVVNQLVTLDPNRQVVSLSLGYKIWLRCSSTSSETLRPRPRAASDTLANHTALGLWWRFLRKQSLRTLLRSVMCSRP